MFDENFQNPNNEMNSSSVKVPIQNQDLHQHQGPVGTMTDKFSEQAGQMGDRLSEEAEKRRLNASERLRQTSRSIESWADNLSGTFDWAKEKTASGIRTASQGVDQMATYLQEKDTSAMMEDTKTLIRKYPGKSMVVGLLLGVVVGKLFR